MLASIIALVIQILDGRLGRDNWTPEEVAEKLRELRAAPPRKVSIPTMDAMISAYLEEREGDA